MHCVPFILLCVETISNDPQRAKAITHVVLNAKIMQDYANVQSPLGQ